jgi:hypothetical protein
MEDIWSGFKEFNLLITALSVGGLTLTAKLAPRIGPGRAAWIALRSRFAAKPMPECLRFAEISLLKERIADKNFRQSYLVVTGEKGVGKTCLLDAVTSKTPGVIKVKAKAGHDSDKPSHQITSMLLLKTLFGN